MTPETTPPLPWRSAPERPGALLNGGLLPPRFRDRPVFRCIGGKLAGPAWYLSGMANVFPDGRANVLNACSVSLSKHRNHLAFYGRSHYGRGDFGVNDAGIRAWLTALR